MEHIPLIIKAMSEYGVSPLNLVLVALVYFMGVKAGTFPRFWKEISKVNDKGETSQEVMPLWAERLIQHFNHDTTDMHTETHTKLDSLIKRVEEEKTEIKDITRGVEKANTTLNEFKEYGIPHYNRRGAP